MSKCSVTVIIPTYNRGHLLPRIVESYLQPEVEKVLFIDDCSQDTTPIVLKELAKRYPKVMYHRNARNLKQAESKNIGLQKIDTPYVYFGDDDSYIEEGLINELLDVLLTDEQCGLAAANAIYLDDDNKPILKTQKEFVNLSNLNVNYTQALERPASAIFCPACFLIQTDLARSLKFDGKSFIGNCFREETDFVLRVSELGYKTVLVGQKAQINLPRSSSTGGSHSASRIRYEYYALRNTIVLIRKHRSYLNQLGFPSTMRILSGFLWSRMRATLSSVKPVYKLYERICK